MKLKGRVFLTIFFFALFTVNLLTVSGRIQRRPRSFDSVVGFSLITPAFAQEVSTDPLDLAAVNHLDWVLENQKIGPLSPFNFLKHAIRLAIESGAQTNTVVLILLLPLVAIIVSALYYLVGLTGFGIFIPAMIAVSFLATGIPAGLVLFAMILFLTLVAKNLLRKIRLHYSSRRAITLWAVCLGTFALFFLSSTLKIFDLRRISIFPILFMVLLSEEFFRFQTGLSKKEAVNSTVGTLFISIAGAFLMSWSWLQEMVLLYPEISSLLILLIGFAIGRYTGFRLSEYRRFRSIWKK